LKGKIRKPRLRKIPLKLAGKIKLSRRLPVLRQRAEKRRRWQLRRKKYRLRTPSRHRRVLLKKRVKSEAPRKRGR
jgi:hypothetical protein